MASFLRRKKRRDRNIPSRSSNNANISNNANTSNNASPSNNASISNNANISNNASTNISNNNANISNSNTRSTNNRNMSIPESVSIHDSSSSHDTILHSNQIDHQPTSTNNVNDASDDFTDDNVYEDFYEEEEDEEEEADDFLQNQAMHQTRSDEVQIATLSVQGRLGIGPALVRVQEFLQHERQSHQQDHWVRIHLSSNSGGASGTASASGDDDGGGGGARSVQSGSSSNTDNEEALASLHAAIVNFLQEREMMFTLEGRDGFRVDVMSGISSPRRSNSRTSSHNRAMMHTTPVATPVMATPVMATPVLATRVVVGLPVVLVGRLDSDDDYNDDDGREYGEMDDEGAYEHDDGERLGETIQRRPTAARSYPHYAAMPVRPATIPAAEAAAVPTATCTTRRVSFGSIPTASVQHKPPAPAPSANRRSASEMISDRFKRHGGTFRYGEDHELNVYNPIDERQEFLLAQMASLEVHNQEEQRRQRQIRSGAVSHDEEIERILQLSEEEYQKEAEATDTALLRAIEESTSQVAGSVRDDDENALRLALEESKQTFQKDHESEISALQKTIEISRQQQQAEEAAEQRLLQEALQASQAELTLSTPSDDDLNVALELSLRDSAAATIGDTMSEEEEERLIEEILAKSLQN